MKQPTTHRWTLIALLLITLLGAALRFYDLGGKGLWLDEAFSVWMGAQSLGEMMKWLIQIDQHPPLYYSLLHLWLNFGDGAVTVRAFSALVSTLAIPLTYFLGQRLGGPSLGLLAALLMATSPFQVRFAQETRMYALLTFNAAAAMLALSYLLTDARAATDAIGSQLARVLRPQHRRPPLQTFATDLAWLGYTFFTVATWLSHNTAIFFPIAINLFVLGLILARRWWPNPAGSLQPPSLRNWLMAQAGVVLLWSPWLMAFIVQSLGVYREFWLPPTTWDRVVWSLRQLIIPFMPAQISWPTPIWYAIGLALLLGLWNLRRQPARFLLLLTLIATPIAGEILVSVQRPLFYDRTLIWITIPTFILLAAGLRQLRYTPVIALVALIFVTFNGLSLREYYLNFEKEQWNDAARFVAEQVEGDDLIIFNATWVQIPFDFYFRDFERPALEHGAPVDLFDRGILEPKMTPADVPRLQSLISRHRRVWLVYSHNWYTDPTSIVPTTISQALPLLQQQSFTGLEVHLYGSQE